MNKLFFTTLIILDTDEEDNVILYVECFKAYRGEGEKAGTETRTVFKSTGITPYDAFTNMCRSTSFPLEYSQNKATIYTENAARHGLKDLLDDPGRNQKINPRQFVFVYSGDPEELLNIKMEDEQFVGLFLDNTMLNMADTANIVQFKLHDLKYERLMGSRVYVLPIIDKIQEPTQERITVFGAAVIKDDIMVDTLNNDQVVAFNFLNDTAKTGSILAENPEHEGKQITLEILQNNIKKTISYDGNKVYFKGIINTIVSVVGAEGGITLTNDEVRKRIEKDAGEKLLKECMDLLYSYGKKDVDILNITRLFEMKYPEINIDIMNNTEVVLEANFNVEGSQNTTDFR